MTENKPIPNKPNRNQKDFKIEQAPTPNNTPSLKKMNSDIDPAELIKKLNLHSEDNQQSATELLSSYLQTELNNLEGAQSDYINELPIEEKQVMYALIAQNDELADIEFKYQLELHQLNTKYQKLRNEKIFNTRKQYINGTASPKIEEIQKGKDIYEADEFDEDEEYESEEVQEGLKYNGIESFWLTALSNLKSCSAIITERDTEVLAYLKDIRCDYIPLSKDEDGEDVFGYSLIFEFGENPFFENTVITKSYYYASEVDYEGGLVYKYTEVETPIEWKSDAMNPTVEVTVKKQKSKKTGKVRSLKELAEVESFFKFFSPPDLTILDEIEDDDEAAEVQFELEEQMGLDYSIAEELKTNLIPKAMDWFTGEALNFADEEEEEEEDEEDLEDYNSQDDGEQSEEEEDELSGAPKTQPPECKQN